MYTVKVYVQHGYFEYQVATDEKALAHAQTIMSTQVYRRFTENGEVEFHHALKVKVCGEGLETEYPDKFRRT